MITAEEARQIARSKQLPEIDQVVAVIKSTAEKGSSYIKWPYLKDKTRIQLVALGYEVEDVAEHLVRIKW